MLLKSAALAVFVLAAPAAFAAGPKVGDAAPSFTGVASSGETVNLADFLGKPVVLEWTNDGCPFVQKHYDTGNMQAAQKAVKEQGGVWISVISSAPGKQGHVSADGANALTADRGAEPAYVLLDEAGVIGRAYAAKTTPHMFVIDAEGALQYAGAIDDSPSADPKTVKGARNLALEAFDKVAAGETVEVRQTKPYGCSVKYGA